MRLTGGPCHVSAGRRHTPCQAIVETLSNSPAFQKFAVRTDKVAKQAAQQATESVQHRIAVGKEVAKLMRVSTPRPSLAPSLAPTRPRSLPPVRLVSPTMAGVCEQTEVTRATREVEPHATRKDNRARPFSEAMGFAPQFLRSDGVCPADFAKVGSMVLSATQPSHGQPQPS